MLTKEEAELLMKTLAPHITGFSLTFQKEGKPEDDVVCGGKVHRIVDMSQWGDPNNNRLVYATLDDGTGELLIVVPGNIWSSVEEEIAIGDIVIASGQLFSLQKECNFVTVAETTIKVKQPDDPLRILVKKIRKLK